ncbi:MAG: homocysteine S-methyltransferase family protein [Deltaproteobacteria bacterium]
MDFLSALNTRHMLFDGATGTMLQAFGLKPGACPDELSLKEPAIVEKVHRAYAEAGSEIITTNTFGANRIKLNEYGLCPRLRDINVEAVRCARRAAGNERFVAGGMGPTGAFVKPVGGMEFDEAVQVFKEQADSLAAGGADLFIIETMMDIKEMKAAIIAAMSTGLPVVATMTFDESLRTVLGTPPESFAILAESLGVAALGANCSLGIEGILRAVAAMRKVASIPFIAQPNAGMPELKQGRTVFPATPAQMASFVPGLVDAGVRLLGGCCGTTPEHIREMGSVFKRLKPAAAKESPGYSALSSRSGFLLFGAGLPARIVGERINPTGRRMFADEIRQGKTATIRNEAREQEAAGAHALDVNVGVPGVDEVGVMKEAVFSVNENSRLPLVIDSSNPVAIEQGLKSVDGKALINSVSAEEKKLRMILPLAKAYGAAVLGLTLDDAGIPETAEARLKTAEAILNAALKLGMRKEDLIIDCLAMTVSASPDSAKETLRCIRLVKERLGLSTALGVSNISFGLPARELVNASFLSMAIYSGLDLCIINPKNKAMMDAYSSSLVLVNKDLRAENYIRRHQAASVASGASQPLAQEKKAALTVSEKLKKAVIEGDEENIAPLIEEALRQGFDPIGISNDSLVPALEEVGRLFAANRYYLPQVMLSAEVMKKAFERLKKELKGREGASRGRVVLATVEGDIHDIGKNILATLLENHGFEVIDLGKNVPCEKIVGVAVEKKADVVGLSALMTTTVMEMDKVIKALNEKGIEAMTIVGGAVVTEDFARKIGATEYGGDAISAVDKLKAMIKRAREKRP